MNAIYMAINGIIDTWRVSLRSQIYSPEGNLGCHGLFALTRNRVKGIWDWGLAGCAQGKRSAEIHRALHVVSPRDLWSCVLPRWQFNVNVNVTEVLKLQF